MKILHIIPSYYPAIQFGGPIESVHLLNKALVKDEMIVDVLTTNSGLKDRKDVLLNQWIDLDGVKVKYHKSFFYEHYTFSPGLLLDALRIAKDYDLIHITAFWNFPVLAGSLAATLNKKPFIISPRGVLYPEAINIKSAIFKKLYLNLVAKKYLYKANVIHFTSQDEKERIAVDSDSIRKSIIIPNGIDLKQYDNLPKPGSFKNKYPVLKNKRYILFLGRVHKQKGFDILLPAFQALVNEYEDLRLVIVGPYALGYKSEIDDWLQKNNLQSKVIFTGLLTGENKFSAYVDAEIFVLPSYFENFGMSVIEAMACGTPIVISNKVGIWKDVQESQAGIIVETNSKSLYLGIKNLLDNQILCKDVTTNAKNLLKEKYSIEIMTTKMISAYNKLSLSL